ncbi:UNVERIFIED_CONTAM: hypothetical protein GTU68_016863 [Idotea baltica]|nr:hypothetical protein [Idotea baltica]
MPAPVSERCCGRGGRKRSRRYARGALPICPASILMGG